MRFQVCSNSLPASFSNFCFFKNLTVFAYLLALCLFTSKYCTQFMHLCLTSSKLLSYSNGCVEFIKVWKKSRTSDALIRSAYSRVGSHCHCNKIKQCTSKLENHFLETVVIKNKNKFQFCIKQTTEVYAMASIPGGQHP